MDINQIQQLCTGLPHVESEIKWKSDLVFMIARKMFCVIDLEALPTSVAFKVPHDDYDEISTRENFKPAPYFAKNKWVTVIDIERLKKSEAEFFIKQSYELVRDKLPKKVRAELGD